MDYRLPVVRHFIACERIDTPPGVGQFSLVNVIHAIRPSSGAHYPRIHPQLCLFVQMTNGRGNHGFQVQLVYLDDETSTYSSQPVTMDLGDDPLIVHGWPLRLRNLLFSQPGVYEFRMLCDDQIIAREAIILREIQ